MVRHPLAKLVDWMMSTRLAPTRKRNGGRFLIEVKDGSDGPAHAFRKHDIVVNEENVAPRHKAVAHALRAQVSLLWNQTADNRHNSSEAGGAPPIVALYAVISHAGE